MDDHPIELSWAYACCRWQVRCCTCGFIRILWWAQDPEDSSRVDALLAKGWLPFRNLHDHEKGGLVILP